MARQTAAQKRRQKRIALALAGLLLLCLAMAALAAFPGLEGKLYGWLGVAEGAVVPGTNSDSSTAVHFINVGQGDAVLLQQDGAFALVDAGPPEGQEALLAYLAAAGVGELQYLFMSHPHADHIGGMQAVLEQVHVGTVVLPDFTLAPLPTSATFLNLLEGMAASGQYTQTAQPGEVYPLGTGAVTVLQAGLAAENLNLQSLALLFEAGAFRFFTTGDAEKQNEVALLESGLALSADLYKAAHHGSSTSNTLEFLRRVRPALVVVCCGQGNSYGHPHLEPLETFATLRATVLRTDLHGSIVVQPGADGALLYASEFEVAGEAAGQGPEDEPEAQPEAA